MAVHAELNAPAVTVILSHNRMVLDMLYTPTHYRLDIKEPTESSNKSDNRRRASSRNVVDIRYA
jgi:hypothetical protein